MVMINCTIKNFVVAINCQPKVNVHLTETVIMNCDIGINCNDLSVAITFDESKIENCRDYGIMYVFDEPNGVKMRRVFSTIDQCRQR